MELVFSVNDSCGAATPVFQPNGRFVFSGKFFYFRVVNINMRRKGNKAATIIPLFNRQPDADTK